jgi:hypothetical protein
MLGHRMAGQLFTAESKTAQCAAPGCERGVRAKGYCGKHYQRIRSGGTTEKRARDLLPWRRCSIKGCDGLSRTRRSGTCHKHYHRFYRTGSFDLETGKPAAPVYRNWTVAQHGYVVKLCKDHPAASAGGYLYQHRAVLYEMIGPGAHPCRWCGDVVEWGAKGARKLVADHLDSDKRNNVPENLAASCHRCNSTRGLFMSWVMKHRDDPFLLAMFSTAR